MAWHNAVPGHRHPYGERFGYCRLCDEAIAEVGGVWWHLQRKSQRAKPKRADNGPKTVVEVERDD